MKVNYGKSRVENSRVGIFRTFLTLCLSAVVLVGAVLSCGQSPQSMRARTLSAQSPLEGWIDDQAGQGARTQALIIQKEGEVLAEIYREDFGPNTPTQLYSVTKSLTALALGAAIEDFGLDLNASVCSWIPIPTDQPVCATTLKAALQMSSGITWTEDYSGSEPSDVLNMLYGSGALDTAAYVARRSRQTAPGDFFRYSSGDTTLLAAILDSVTGGNSRSYVRERIFEPMGLGSFVWEGDAAGTLNGAAGAHMTARDLIKIGDALLSDERRSAIVSESFFRDSLTPVVLRKGTPEEETRPYGYQWWLNSAGTRNPETDRDPSLWRFPHATSGTYAAFGHFGQMLVVIPEENILIARLGSDKTGRFDLNSLIGLVRTGQIPSEANSDHSGREFRADPWDYEFRPLSPLSSSSLEVEPAVGYTALSYCSCRFVSHRSHEACLERVQVPEQPVIPVFLNPAEPFLVQSQIGQIAKRARFYESNAGVKESESVVDKGCQIVP